MPGSSRGALCAMWGCGVPEPPAQKLLTRLTSAEIQQQQCEPALQDEYKDLVECYVFCWTGTIWRLTSPPQIQRRENFFSCHGIFFFIVTPRKTHTWDSSLSSFYWSIQPVAVQSTHQLCDQLISDKTPRCAQLCLQFSLQLRLWTENLWST